ncbi:MAG: peptide chain release factor N(5)-glutamine methyltransferase [Candidatus Doudnabacteria bacterium]|nr:peptide chain release factor N(5)-glutamine methyltransferase [Candidatus Doudnabacteria bacterium]
MTIIQALNYGATRLKSASDSPALDAEVLLSFVLKKPKTYLYTHSQKTILKKKLYLYLTLVKQKIKGWPIAYLTGEKEFFGLKFLVTRHVLIPRPESEGLVELVQEQIQRTYFGRPRILCPLKILDVGTGSGCIIISIAKSLNPSPPTPLPKGEGSLRSSFLPTGEEIPSLISRRGLGRRPDEGHYQFFASDISKKALAVAKKNALIHKVKIQFKQGHLLAPWKNQSFDVIVANLPYLTKLEDRSTRFEPKQALVAGKKGLTLIEKLLKQIRNNSPALVSAMSPPLNLRGGWGELLPKHIFLEFDPRQTAAIKKLANKYLPNYSTKISNDLNQKSRFALLEMK